MPHQSNTRTDWVNAMKKAAELSPEKREALKGILTNNGKCDISTDEQILESRKAGLLFLKSAKSDDGKPLLDNTEYSNALFSLEKISKNAIKMKLELKVDSQRKIENWLKGGSQTCSPTLMRSNGVPATAPRNSVDGIR